MKTVKIFFTIVLLIIVIAIFAAGSLVYFVDPNDMKPALIKEVKAQTGYDMVLDGKLSWSFYPVPGVKAAHLQLKKPEATQVFIDATHVQMAIDLSDVLSGRRVLKGTVRIAKLQFMNIKGENVSGNINVKNNFFTADNIKATLYDGTLVGVVNGRDMNTSRPQWDWNLTLSHAQLNPLLQDVNGGQSKIKIFGMGSFKLQAQTSGITREQLLRQLNGTSTFSVENGNIEGMDLNYFIQLADAAVNKKPTEQLVNDNQTSFSHLSGTAVIKNGIANTDDLLLMAPNFVTHAKGNIELLSSDLDFELNVKPQIEGKQIKWDIPVLLKGDLQHPEVKLDFMEIQKIIAGREINNLKEKALIQIEKHVPGKTGQFLQNLLRK